MGSRSHVFLREAWLAPCTMYSYIVPWPRGTFAFFVRGSRFAVICASRFSFVLRGSRFAVICASRFSFVLRGSRFVLRGSRFAVICASHFTFVLRGSRFLIRGSYFLVRASQFAVRGSWPPTEPEVNHTRTFVFARECSLRVLRSRVTLAYYIFTCIVLQIYHC